MFDANLCFSMNHHNVVDYFVDYHTHDCYEIVYYISGTGVSKIRDTEYEYNDYSFCVIPPNTEHSEWTAQSDLMYVGFNYDGKMGELPLGLMQDDEKRTIYNILTEIQHELSTQNICYKEMLNLLQKQLIVALLRQSQGATGTMKKKRECLEYAVNFIDSNYGTQICLENLANSVGYSYHHFRHMFRSTYEISPKQYILNVRMTHAKLFLQQEELSVKEIAQMCGFRNTSQFISTFKKHTGLSPLAYRSATANFEERAQYKNN